MNSMYKLTIFPLFFSIVELLTRVFVLPEKLPSGTLMSETNSKEKMWP